MVSQVVREPEDQKPDRVRELLTSLDPTSAGTDSLGASSKKSDIVGFGKLVYLKEPDSGLVGHDFSVHRCFASVRREGVGEGDVLDVVRP